MGTRVHTLCRSHVPLWILSKQSQANQRKMVWKTRLSASSDFTETKKNQQEKPVCFLKTTQKHIKFLRTLDIFPSMVANYVVREISLQTRK
jgi:hypothetical protein